jgi:hypothetical protein
MQGAVITVVSAPFCPVAEAVTQLLRAKGASLGRPRPGPNNESALRLELRGMGQARESIVGCVPILERLEEEFSASPAPTMTPLQRAHMRETRAYILRANDRLHALLRARDATDFDIAVHFLCGVLAQVEDGLNQNPISLPAQSALLDALAWRLATLDKHFKTHLLDRFPALAQIAAKADAPQAKDWLAHIRALGGVAHTGQQVSL